MPLGRTHDSWNLLIGGTCLGYLWGQDFPTICLVSFMGGWFFATFIFSPDTDLRPRKKIGKVRYLLFPYSWFFRHRGFSHDYLVGTLTRVLYGLFLGILILTLFSFFLNYIRGETLGFFLLRESFDQVKVFLKNYDYHERPYQGLTWFFGGMYLADLTHLTLDKLVSLVKKIF